MAKIKKFLIIDANSLIHRAYHALPPLTTKDGRLVNAVYGFANILLKVLREQEPDYLAVCFDLPGGTFRDEIYEDYKAGREDKPQEFHDQFPVIKELLVAMNIKIYEKQGYEADDIIGTLSRKTLRQAQGDINVKNIILTGDMDMLQLVDDHTEVERVKKGVSDTLVYNPQTVKRELGLRPGQIIDYKALRGDASDNIPGVPGIGNKTATDLIQQYGNLEKLYEHVNDCKHNKDKCQLKPALLDKLFNYKPEAKMSRLLVTIKRNVPLKFKLEDVKVKPLHSGQVVSLIQDLGFKSLLNRLPKSENLTLFGQNQVLGIEHQAEKQEIKNKKLGKKNLNYQLIDSDAKFKKFITELKKQKIFALDTETDQKEAVGAELVGMSFSWKSGTGYYIPYENLKSEILNLKSILENPRVRKTGHNIKYDYQVLKQAGINLSGITFDSMIASYLFSPGSRSHSLDALAFTEFGVRLIPIKELIGSGKDEISMKDVAVAKVAEYAAEDADITWRLYEKLAKHPDLKHLKKVFYDIEMPLAVILGDMELRGIKIDTNLLRSLTKKLESSIKNHESKIFKLAGSKFNVASPVQLKEILFDKLKLPIKGLSKTKTGISTSHQNLEKLRSQYKIIDYIMEFREMSKLKNTYTDALPKLVSPVTGRVHTSFNQAVAATGRLSSSNPNLQNIPIRTDLGTEIRAAFVADKGYKIVSADYSQFELRIVASLSKDHKMIAAFKSGEDIHRRTAADVYDLPLDQVTRQQRREAKEVNFGIIYGLGVRGLAQRTGVSHEKAKEFYNKYFELHPRIKDYLRSVVDTVRSLGYAETMFGRRRYFPEINAEHPMLRAAAERAAVNLPIQGTQADLIKIAMIELDKKLKKQNLENDIRMLLQVHDELLLEVKAATVKKAIQMIKDTMEAVAKLEVPIEVHVGAGDNWKEAK